MYIGIIKEVVVKDMEGSNCPIPSIGLLCQEGEQGSTIRLRMIASAFTDRVVLLMLARSTVFPFNCELLGRVLGPAMSAGYEKGTWYLQVNGKVVSRSSLRPLQVAK